MLRLQLTPRFFRRGEFTDTQGTPCVLQESSAASEPCIWLGLMHKDAMHLNQRQVADLLPYLQRFVATGHL